MKRTTKPPAGQAIDQPEQVRALASTVRQDIVDTLQALGSASVPELAEHLARAPDSLYYHVRELLKTGLLVRLPLDRVRAGRREAVYATAQTNGPMRLAYRAGAGEPAQALAAVVGSMLRAAGRDFEAAIEDPTSVVEGPLRELWAGRCKGWLSDAELARCNLLLTELTELLSRVRTPERNRLFCLQFLLAPERARAPSAAPSRPTSTTAETSRRRPPARHRSRSHR